MGTIDSIFCNAIDIESPQARHAYLDEACGGDADVRRRVDKLLAAHFNGGGLLDAPPPGLPDIGTDHFAGVDAAPLDAVAPGTTVDGRYRLLEVIGEGGMGVVYKAEQTRPVRRTVALKLIKLGMDTREVVARFHAERQALALMDHAHVARVFDAGATDAGRPYFVMEHVPGEPITAYCDRRQLKIPDRLRLFMQACEAVHHAHQKAILHRDLKPGNILVAGGEDGGGGGGGGGKGGGGDPSVKIIDFGIAKALGRRLTERTLCTSLAQLVGTPEYMSPEQAETGGGGGAGHDVDTRSDIYSLGVVLYELVTGAPPWDPKTFRGVSPGDVQRILREHEPPRPSTRLSALSGDDAARAAERRASEPRALLGQLRSELEWIPLKAMAKDREERYRSVAELADDVRNYLEHRPLIAGPRTRAYRVRKFLAKHRRASASAAAVASVVLALVVALAVTARQAVSARRAEEGERRRAEGEAGRAAAERDRALAAERATDAERRRAETLLARSLADQADALDAAGGAAAAWAGFARAAQAFERVGLPPRAAEIGLLRSYDAHPPPLMVMPGHAGEVLAADLARDGTRAISAGADGAVKLWDVPTGRELRTLAGHEGRVFAVAFSPDGRAALTAGADASVRLWDVESGRTTHVLRGHATAARAVAFHPDGRRAISGGDDGTMRLWDLGTGSLLRTFAGHNGGVRAVAVGPDGRLALAGSDGNGDPSLTLWDVESGSKLRTLDGDRTHRTFNSGVRAILFEPDAAHVITAGYDLSVKRWDLATPGPPVQVVGGTTSHVEVALSADGSSLYVGGDDGALKMYDVATGRERRRFHGCTRGVRGVAVSGDGGLVFAGSADGALRVWGAAGGGGGRGGAGAAAAGPREAREVELGGPFSEAWFTWGGLLGVAEVPYNAVVIFDVATGRPLRRIASRDPAVRPFLAPGRARLLRHDRRGEIVLSRWGEGKADALRIPWDNARPCRVEVGADGRSVAFAGDDGAVTLWDLTTGKPTWTIGGQTGHATAAISPDGTRVITCGAEHEVHVWDVATRSRLCTLPFPGGVEFVFAPDGRRVLTGNNAGLVQLWDAQSGREVRQFVGHGSAIMNLRFRDEGRTAVTVSSDGILMLWDVETGAPAGRFSGGAGRLLTWDLSDDGRTLLTGRQTGPRSAELVTWALDRPAAHRRFQQRQDEARRLPQGEPQSLQVFGEWYAFRAADRLALPLLEQARRRDANSPALPVARVYWRQGRIPEAADAFRRALDRNEAPAEYLRLCLAALDPAAAQ